MFKFKVLLSSLCVSLLCIGGFCFSASSATLVVKDGQLMGAHDVLVHGEHYDVAFVDGVPSEQFPIGEENAILFNSKKAQAASQALLDQVFIDTKSGHFDTKPEMTTKITEGTLAIIATPYSYSSNKRRLLCDTALNSAKETDERTPMRLKADEKVGQVEQMGRDKVQVLFAKWTRK